ncbi:MAG TPA: hypothetical protein VHL57_11940 [Flavobacteriales bacterium]|jgi:hypothetical protein|nr:hypothetical protein [Flavobacteriales bacterium]
MRHSIRYFFAAVLTLGLPMMLSASTAAPLRIPPHRSSSATTRPVAVQRPESAPTAASPLRVRNVKG